VGEALDREVRLTVYGRFVEDGRPPSVEEAADALGVAPAEVAGAYRRLQEGHVLVLAPGSLDVWMANPLSAVPTPYRVATARGSWWGNCIWDALGIPAMLGEDATIASACPDCSEPLELTIRDGELRPAEGVAHFAVPARSWWENIGYT
jgi:hypothetical protein